MSNIHEIQHLTMQHWSLVGLVLLVVAVFGLSVGRLTAQKREPESLEPTNQAAFALAVFGLVGAVLVLALGFAAYKCSDDLLALLAIIFGLGLLSDLKSGADKIAFRKVKVTERPAERENIRVGDHQSLAD